MSGLGCVVVVLVLSGLLLVKKLLMLVILVLELLVLKVLPFLCPPLLLLSFSVFLTLVGAVRCLLPLGWGRFLNLVVLFGYQGSDTDTEQLALTEQLFDAALAELGVVARGSPCLLAGDFNVEPTKIPCLSKGISAGLWVDLDAAWSDAKGQLPAVACKHSWISTGGSRRDFLLVARWLLLLFYPVPYLLAGGCSLILLFLLRSIVIGGLAG